MEVSEWEVLKHKTWGFWQNGNEDFLMILMLSGAKSSQNSKGGFDVSDMFSAKFGFWVSVAKCCSNLNLFSIDLNKIMVRKICNGINTLFWFANWIKGCGPLKDRYPRLFALEQHKTCLVTERWAFSNRLGLLIGHGAGSLQSDVWAILRPFLTLLMVSLLMLLRRMNGYRTLEI